VSSPALVVMRVALSSFLSLRYPPGLLMRSP
jgi:hypothetical protein